MAGSMTALLNLIAKPWNSLGAPLRHGLAWATHAKFIHGVCGIIVDERGRVLLLKHRFWKHQRWGLPGGLARHGETLAATLRRELREETGLDVRPSALLRVDTAARRMTVFILMAECEGEPRALSPEIMDARFCERGQLPENLLEAHRELIEAIGPMPNGQGGKGLPLI